MKTLNVQVSATDKNYSAYLEDATINGMVIATAKTLDKLKEEFVSALDFHLQGCIEDGNILPNYIINKNYLLRYDLDVSATLLQMKSLVGVPVISRVTNINQKQLHHYASGLKKPRPAQRQKIKEGLHQLGRELLSIDL